MQTCSNCGSESRDGARFCTTCGSRLNDIANSEQGSGWVSYPSPELEPEPAPESIDVTMISPAVADESDTDHAPASSTNEPESVGPWGDVAGAPSDEQLVAEATANVISESDDEPPVAATTENESLSSWANQWSMTDVEDAEPDAETTPTASTSEDRFAVSGSAIDYIAAQEIDTDVDADTEPVSLTGLNPNSDGHAQPPTPKERAQALVHELRELIDESFAPSSTAANTRETGGSGEALATLNTLSGEDGSFDNLRIILEKAKEQPRDVDTMLNLLGEINALIALVDSHQRYVEAVETAKRQLS